MKSSNPLIKNRELPAKYIRYSFLIIMFAQFAVFAVMLITDPSGEQINVFFHSTADFFADLFNVEKYTYTKDPYCFARQAADKYDRSFYLPLANMVFYFLSKFSDCSNATTLKDFYTPASLATAFIFITFTVIMLFAMLYCWLSKRLSENRAQAFLITFSLFCSGVFLFSVERGNIIILAVALTGFYIAGYKSDNKIIRELSYISLALAAALKIYPAVLGLLLIFDKRWKDAFRLMIYGAAAVFLPFLFFEGGFRAIPLFIENMKIYNQLYDIFAFDRLNFRYYASMGGYLSNDLTVFLYAVMPFVDAILSILCVLSAPLQKEEWKKYAALIMPIVIFPSNSGIYNYLYIFIIIACFLSKNKYTLTDINYTVLFILMLTPVQKMFIYDGPWTNVLIRTNTIIVNTATWLIFLFIGLSAARLLLRFTGDKITEVISKNKKKA